MHFGFLATVKNRAHDKAWRHKQKQQQERVTDCFEEAVLTEREDEVSKRAEGSEACDISDNGRAYRVGYTSTIMDTSQSPVFVYPYKTNYWPCNRQVEKTVERELG